MARILICDDSDFMRGVIKEILEEAGHEIIGEADDGSKAVEMYKEYKPDAVTMDIVMKVGGVEAIQKIVEMDKKAKILVVSVLEGSEGELVDAVKSGAMGYITKPIRKESLIAEMERVLGGDNG